MSLNDPRWGRKGSEDDSSQKENEIKEPPKETDEEPRKAEPSKNEMPGRFAQNNNDGDLEELWKQFNDRLNSMLGTKGNQNRNAQKEEPSASSQTQNQKNEDYDFDEPPLQQRPRIQKSAEFVRQWRRQWKRRRKLFPAV